MIQSEKNKIYHYAKQLHLTLITTLFYDTGGILYDIDGIKVLCLSEKCINIKFVEYFFENVMI
jgi:hypothetical protein